MSVGWLAGSIRPDDEVTAGWSIVKRLGGPSTQSDGNRHYSKGVRADDWSWQVLWSGTGGATGTVYVEARQGLFERLGEAAGLRLAVDLLGSLRPSRIDLAGDVVGGTRPERLFERRADATTRTHRDGWECTLRGDGGAKLTVGARSSDRYLRVYVKGERIRHELELKGAVARSAGESVVWGLPLADIWSAEYGRLVQWPS